jgi:integral membrane sensor domain MASE1
VSVDKPPKISEVPARPVPIEVLPPLPPPPAQSVPSVEGPPIHGLSALILVAVDSLWIPGDFLMPVSLVAVPACFAAVFIPTYLIQRHLKNDSKGRALTFATILAVLAAIPTPITGTPVGFALLAWTGLGKLLGRSPSK